MTVADIDVFWVLLCSCLVWAMQAGFLCLETGLTRSKNNINVALKNICDNASSIFLFWLVGFSVAFGTPFTDPFDWDGNFYFFESPDNKLNAFFVFQVVFCSTCCTIVSGAAAERLRFIMYPVAVAIIAGVIYPVAVNFIWGGQMIPNDAGPGLLASWGFYDFAGATAVHSTGGWVALAVVIIIGPRLGRFARDGAPQTIQGSNLTLSSLGVLILWFGWLGFNGGSAYSFEANLGIILSNTLVAGATSLIVTLLIAVYTDGVPKAEDLINGALGGLVGITGAADCVSSVSACLIGVGSALFVLAGSRLLLRMRIDDVVGAVPVHLAAGIWGTLAVGLFADLDSLGTALTRFELVLVQLAGIGVIGAWAFGAALVLLTLINRFFPLRVPRNDEAVGLNISEHGATSELYELIAFMKYQSDTVDLEKSAPADLFTEIGVVGMAYNHLTDALKAHERKLRAANAELEAANEALRSYDDIVAHDLKNPISVIRSYAALIEEEEMDDKSLKRYVDRIRRSSEDALAMIRELLNFSKANNEILEKEKIDIRELVYFVNLKLLDVVRDGGAKIVLDLEIDDVRFNRFALQQVLINLIGNAIKYAAPDRAPIIVIRSRREDDAEIIEVGDNGLGMDEAQQARVFDKHTRFHAAADIEGDGIGMYMVKRLVESGGGSVAVRSAPGRGTTISLLLPRGGPAAPSPGLTVREAT